MKSQYEKLTDQMNKLEEEIYILKRSIFYKNQFIIAPAIKYLAQNKELLNKITGDKLKIEFSEREHSPEIWFYRSYEDDTPANVLFYLTITSEEDLREAIIELECVYSVFSTEEVIAIGQAMLVLENKIKEIASYWDKKEKLTWSEKYEHREMLDLLEKYEKKQNRLNDLLEKIMELEDYESTPLGKIMKVTDIED